MAFHDDVDDANDANDKTSSEHEFELPSPRRASSSIPEALPADEGDDGALVDLSEASRDRVFNLDAAAENPVDAPHPAPSASDFVPIDLNDEFQRSELADGLDQGMPPWAMAPAPDPTQAVSQLDAPNGLAEDRRAVAPESDSESDSDGSVPDAGSASSPMADFAPKAAAAPAEDPYQIPVDYTTPDFFAARISRRRPKSEPAEDSSQLSEEFAEPEQPEQTEVESEFNFASLFAAKEPVASPGESEPVSDTSWAEVAPAGDQASEAAANEDSATNNLWKLGPLEPNAPIGSAPPSEPPAIADPINEIEEVPAEAPPAVDAPLEPFVTAAPSEFSTDAFTAAAAELAPKQDVSSSDDDQLPVPDAPLGADMFDAQNREGYDAWAPEESAAADEVLPASFPESAFSSDAAETADSFGLSGAEASAEASEWRETLPVTEMPDAPAVNDATDEIHALDRAESPAQSEVDSDLAEQFSAPELSGDGVIPTPPVRRSMADDELLTWADDPDNQSTGALSVIEVLEAQLRLREEEAREYREWETTLRSKGAPAAEDDDNAEQTAAASHEVGSTDDEMIPPTVAERAAAPEEPASAPHIAALPPTPPVSQLPSWDVPPPSDTWAPGDDFEDEIPFAANADPTGSITLPELSDEAPEELEELEELEEVAASSEPLNEPTSEAVLDSDTGDKPDVAVFAAPVSAPQPVSEPQSEHSAITEGEHVPEPETASFDEHEAAAETQATPKADFEVAESAEEYTAEAEAADVAEVDSVAHVAASPAVEIVAPAEPEPTPSSSQFDEAFGLLSLDDVPVAPAFVEFPAKSIEDSTVSSQPQQSPEFPEDEDGGYDEIAFAPPPLVEPITAPSTPRSNLDEHVSFGDFGFTPPISGEPEVQSESEMNSAAGEAAGDVVDESPFAFGLNSPPVSDDSSANSSVSNGTEDTDSPVSAPAAEDSDMLAAPIADSEATPVAFSFASQATPRYVPSAPQNFDDLLKVDEFDDSDVASEDDDVDPLDGLLTSPDQEVLQQGDPLSLVQTGSIPIGEALFETEAESDEAVDASDRLTFPADLSASNSALDSNPIPFATGAFAAATSTGGAGEGATAAASATSAATATAAASMSMAAQAADVPEPMPLSTARVSQQPLGLDDVAPTAQPVFSLEESGLEPTPIDRRVGHAARMFWLWFAANSSVVSLGLGAAVFSVGMSLRQSVVAILAGVALSFIPLGLTTLAGKRSGQPTMVISRSTFGLLGNIVPSVVALIARLFWGAVLLWVLASSVAIVLIGSDVNVGLGDRQLLLISLALAFLVALVIAFAGYPLFARIQLILSIISGVLVVGLIAFTAQYVDISTALTTPDGSWLLTLTGAVLVFSFLGLVWAYSGADIARYQRVSSSGAGSALSAAFGATVPAFVLIAYGALLAASDPAIARGFLASPLDTLLQLLPGWYPIPLLLAAALSLLSGITLSLYSGGFALQAIGVRVPRQWSIVIVGVLLGALAILFAFGVTGGINELFRDVATTLAVPTAAWAGIFAAETMIRTRRLDSAALTTRGGVYADVRWMNLGALVLISVIGFALTSATIGWLSWQGYGFTAMGIDLNSELAATDLGVLVALALGILTPLVVGIPAIRRQEAGRSERAVRPA